MGTRSLPPWQLHPGLRAHWSGPLGAGRWVPGGLRGPSPGGAVGPNYILLLRPGCLGGSLGPAWTQSWGRGGPHLHPVAQAWVPRCLGGSLGACMDPAQGRGRPRLPPVPQAWVPVSHIAVGTIPGHEEGGLWPLGEVGSWRASSLNAGGGLRLPPTWPLSVLSHG